MLRSTLMWLAGNQQSEKMVRGCRVTRSLIDRFVAGENLDEALGRVRDIHSHGQHTTLDLLGENVSSAADAQAAADAYVQIIGRLRESGFDPNISIKLTMIGLDLDEGATWERLQTIVGRAADLGGFVRVDMEGSAYTEQTLALFRRIHDLHPEHVGIVLQAMLYRTERDVDEMIERRARVRLVKGAYNEPETVAFPLKGDVDAAYRRHLERLLETGTYPAIATHDESILRVARGYAGRMGIGKERFEFQMLYGVRRDLQQQLADDGYNMRVYVPFGTSWYPYFMRRLAERPANVLFVARNVVRS
ncbi:MAG TPA: proline dehydrogenase family protein [Thermomicrobiales bacterium]|nr:proline dehydrogenase [Chloroflexota bacterium]HQZ90193.1 proline dehydrogenase family protein [Thermomicrobiales bacterium]HRA30718.1 proline dehydrogenase family protein [Thermomicrobiales bacterium]